jgi:hypothetical protein
MFYHACRAGDCSIWQATLLYIGVRIGAALPLVAAWKGALEPLAQRPRMTRLPAELQIESDFQMTAERVLSQGETDDPIEIEKRVDLALASLIAVSR